MSVLLAWAIAARLGRRSQLRWLGLATGLAVYSAVLVVDWVLVAE
ncbi:hypothetical protein [Amycolatopsis nalaikhensis]|uniref:Uncharacterized protein n=1 Tax=Amycolatopsis nalaikhensis TaxID=715472 RepID=A0ABY8XA96_9PSEU|nr:hypothetical protein [Amycolatopsis sp. 2-2]WIV52825.1 hypothetical protein QP939_28185 [Amycolatopsis sp. 2-2]